MSTARERSPSDLVGRDHELASLVRAAERGVRMVCISGPAGVGKTALARALLASTPGIFCGLEGAVTESGLTGEVAASLGLPMPTTEGPVAEERLLSALAARGPQVVVIDAAERSAVLVDEIVKRWSGATPAHVTFVVTSQIKLPSAELVVSLDPLALPDAEVTTSARALESAAVRLFVARATESSGFSLAEADVADVVALVRALDGLPLAILLGAARVGLLGVARTRELLARRFDLLVGPGAGRHRSLEAALGWSWDLLNEPQRRTLTAAAAFRAGFTIEAMHAVLYDASADRDELTTLARLEELLSASMLVVSAPPVRGRGARFSLYESVREFARAAAPPDWLADAESRHARYFIQEAEARAAAVTGGGGADARRWLAEEAMNVVVASDHLARDGATAEALQAALSLEAVRLERGPVEEHLRRVERLLAALDADGASADTDLELRARALASIGLAQMVAGRREEAVGSFRRAFANAERAGAKKVAARAASKAALITGLTGDAKLTRELYDDARRLAGECTDPNLAGIVAKDRGMVLSELGDNAAAIAAFHDALAGFRAAGDVREEAFTLAAIGARYLDGGELVDAKQHVTRAVAALEAIGDERTLAWAHLLLALVALEESALADASAHAERALARVRSVGDRLTEGLVLGVSGHVALEAGRIEEATQRYRDAAALLERTRDDRNAAIVLGAWAAAAATAGERAEAQRLHARAESLARDRGRPGDDDALRLFGCVLRIREAEDAAARGSVDEARAHLSAIDDLIAKIGAADSAVHKSDEVRLALRVARRAQADVTPRVTAMIGAATGATDSSPFVVAEDGSWFRLPSGEVMKLRGKPVAARLLRTLAERAIASPAAPVPASALIAAGWPGEKIMPSAANNRLYVAMTRLRRLGLGELLRNEGDGYFLSAAVPVRFAR